MTNAMTVDVEDYFQVSAFRHVIRYDEWGKMESRVERNTRKVLDLLAEFNVQGTFFILGWIAERFPALVRSIQAAGHELGCHSYAHRLVYEMTPEEFHADTRRALQVIEDAAGVPIRAYRAPSFSITPRSVWALEILLDLGFTLDSSVFPVHHDLYGFPDVPRQPFRIQMNAGSLIEFPPPTFGFGPWNLPVTGGGYLRLLPMAYQTRILRCMGKRNEFAQLYFHPWELDPEQPRIDGSWRSRFRHRIGLHRTEERLRRLLAMFRFNKLSSVLRSCESMPEFVLSISGAKQFAALEVPGA